MEKCIRMYFSDEPEAVRLQAAADMISKITGYPVYVRDIYYDEKTHWIYSTLLASTKKKADSQSLYSLLTDKQYEEITEGDIDAYSDAVNASIRTVERRGI